LSAITASALRQQIADGETAPLYVLVGQDEIEKSEVAAEFGEIVDEGLRPFNVDRLYAADVNVDEVMDIANTLPMMAPRRVVIVFEAEKLLVPRRESQAADAEQERLAEFLASPPPHATVVFVCGALDMRRRVVKLLLKQAHVIECGVIGSHADAERWVKVRAGRERVTFAPGASALLIERTGLDIVRLRAGFDRVVMYAMGQPAVTVDAVREAVPPGPDAEEDFGIANAVRDGDAGGALRQLGAALERGAVPVMVLGQLRWIAEKMPPARIGAAIDAVFRTDVALKSSGGDPRILLERLVVELCHGGRSVSPRRRSTLNSRSGGP
jgi:DNA polymerase-3 subunit delta